MAHNSTQGSFPKNSENRNTISILGCGWLGFPLAQKLIALGFSVKGSTTSEKKIVALQRVGIRPFLVQLKEEKVIGEIVSFLEDSETLIIAIPPGLRKAPKENFVQKIKKLLPHLEKSSIKNLLFISSSTVYKDEEDFPEITEKSPLNASSEAGKQLIAVEKLLRENTQFKTTILRFGGLIGADRHPIKFLAGKSGVKNPEAPVNLIHREDCIQIIIEIIKQEAWDQTFNAVYPLHPTKKEYYCEIAKKRKLPMPVFEESMISKGKIIVSEKLKEQLRFTFLQEI